MTERGDREMELSDGGCSGSRWESEERAVEGGVKGPSREGVSLGVPTHCLCGAEDIVTSPSWRNTQFPWQVRARDSLNLAQPLHLPLSCELKKPCCVPGSSKARPAIITIGPWPHIWLPQSSDVAFTPHTPSLMCFSVHVCVQSFPPPSQLPPLKFSQQT